MNDQWLTDDAFYIHSRIERAERVLKDYLHIAAQAAHFTMISSQQIAALEAQAAGTWLDQPQYQSAESALARSRFAHQAKSFASEDVE